jgi:hypothetical protein
MLRTVWVILVLAWGLPVVAGLPIPSGLQPGDHYQVIFATSFTAAVSPNSTFPPSLPYFTGLDQADYLVTYAAYQANLLPNWNQTDLVYHAILSTDGHNAKDRLDVEAPLYNMQGEFLAADATDLWAHGVATPIAYDEYGTYITNLSIAWTGTQSNGLWSGQSAGDWNAPTATARVGLVPGRGIDWIGIGIGSAKNALRLYGLSPVLTVPAGPLGDYNHNYIVDAADYTVWRDTLGSTTDLRANGDNTGASAGKIDQADFLIWKANFGAHLGSASAVPEPASAILITMGLLLVAIGYRRGC